VIWAWIGQLIAGPLVEAYRAKLAAGNTKDALAAELAKRELDVQAAEIEAQKQMRIAQIGHWYTPENLLGYIMVAYFAKVVLWDKVVMGDWINGRTDALVGDAAEWGMLIMLYYFGKRTVESAIRIWKGK